MHSIMKQTYGLHIMFRDILDTEELKVLIHESKEYLELIEEPFGVFLDIRNLLPMSFEVIELRGKSQKYYREKGMSRSVIVVDNLATAMQFKTITKESNTHQMGRYINSWIHRNWDELGENWLLNGIDPDRI